MASTRHMGSILMDPGGTPGTPIVTVFNGTGVVEYTFVLEGKDAGIINPWSSNGIATKFTGPCLKKQITLLKMAKTIKNIIKANKVPYP